MLSAIVRSSVRYRGIVIGLAVALVVYGISMLARSSYDVFPEFAPPQVEIQTESPGLTPEQVELLVTTPLEQAIDGTAGVATVRSKSIQGLSDVTVLFGSGDVYRDRQLVAERLAVAGRRLPSTVHAPVITPLTSSTGIVLVIGLTSNTSTPRQERTFADWTVVPRLLAVPGVAAVATYGGSVRELQIQVDPARLRAHGLEMADVVAMARQATGVEGAGVIDNTNQRILVRTEGQLSTPALLAGSVVRERNGAVLRLGDLAHVIVGGAPRVGEASIDGQPGVLMLVSGQLGTNTRVVTAAVEQALGELAPVIRAEGMTLHPALFRPANFVDLALHNVAESLAIGGVLVAVVLVLFLADLGTAAVSLTAIPVSLLAALIVLEQFGLSINTLTLGGLAIAIGEVVDDAIIDVENIARRLRENRALPHPRPAAAVVIDASLEVRSSVVYATFVVMLVFAPIIALSGVQGALFRPLALAYILAILGSLVVALTLTPALTLTLLARRQRREKGEPGVLRWLKHRFVLALGRLERHPRAVMMATGALIVAAVIIVPFFGVTFLPDFNEGHLIVHMTAEPGTSLDESLALGRAVSATLLRDPRVRSVAQKAGRAELGTETRGTNASEFEVDLAPVTGDQAKSLQRDLRRELDRLPGASFAINAFLTERINETVSGEMAPIVIKLFGNDLDSLDVAAREVAGAVSGVPGTADILFAPPPVVPEATVRIDPAAAAAAGIPAAGALAAVRTATGGVTVGEVFDGNRPTPVVVKLDTASLTGPEDLANIPLAGSGGRIVPLGDIASVARTSGRFVIAHEGARRVLTVTANVTGRDATSIARAIQRQLSSAVRLPRGVYAELTGTVTEASAAQHELLLRSGLAAVGIVILLWLAFGDTRRLLLVLVNLPFALVGGVFAVFATGGILSLGSLVGFVTLFGITTRNAIMLISHYDHLVAMEGATWGPETAIRGAAERLGPILITALVTGLGLLPLAIGSGAPGREIESPLAIVILGGLVTSTLLSLFVLPTLSLAFGRFGPALLMTDDAC